MDLNDFNLQLLAVVRLQNISLQRIDELRQSALEGKDHNQLAVIKLDKDVLWNAISAKYSGN